MVVAVEGGGNGRLSENAVNRGSRESASAPSLGSREGLTRNLQVLIPEVEAPSPKGGLPVDSVDSRPLGKRAEQEEIVAM